ncbi:MAG: winged helix-turn-helix domain-containing protein [Methanobrevibacter sp.]|nr:winged helix-turn-helix domain-containing protein [Candidatus Methanovirga aequatorialis]
MKDKFNVDYSTRQVSRILRELGFKYGKPYIIDIKRPNDAENQLKKLK